MGTPDILRRDRRPAVKPSFVRYVIVRNLAINVPLTPAPISTSNIPCFSILVQADLANGGVIEVGGMGVTVTTGLQLIAGAGTFYYASQPVEGEPFIRSGLGIGVEKERGFAGETSGHRNQYLKVISLNQIWTVTNLDGQIARITYTTWST